MHVNCMCITKGGMHCYACKLHVYNKGGYAFVMHVNCMCITKVGMHCYACKLHLYNKGGYALLCI